MRGQQYNLWKFKDTDRINTDQYNLKQLMYDKSYDDIYSDNMSGIRRNSYISIKLI